MQTHAIAILGAGFSGLAAAIALQARGHTDFVLLDGGSAVGGTWRDNTYPGAACDVPSHLYSLSTAPNPNWTHSHARQPEILAYMESLVDQFDLRERLRLDTRVESMAWTGSDWELTTSAGRFRATHVFNGLGALRDPRWPELPGRDGFAGRMVHTARWPRDLAVEGLRVGVIGTGASAIQLVPELAKTAAAVEVFQRTAPWIRPRNDVAFSARRRRAYQRFPLLQKAHRLALWASLESNYPLFFGPLHRRTRPLDRLLARRIRAEVPPSLRDAVTPTYRLGCKRVLVSDDWFPALNKPYVTLHTTPLQGITPEGVQFEDGSHVDLDVLVAATGFHVDAPLGELEVYGAGGVSLREQWGARPSAHLGVSTPNFPNLFLLLGPNTALGHSSVLLMIEAAVGLAVQLLEHSLETGPLMVRQAAHDQFVDWVDTTHDAQVWASGCDSWYHNAAKENFTLWPGSTWSYLRATRRLDPTLYECAPKPL